MAAAHAGVNPRWLLHDGFPDPLFAVGDGQGCSQPQELALGALQAWKRAELAHGCDVCLSPHCAVPAPALWWPSCGGITSASLGKVAVWALLSCVVVPVRKMLAV